MRIQVKCQICSHVLGACDTDNLKVPLMGAMFESIKPGQFPEPFHCQVDWRWMKCPMCRKRPFLREDAVMDDQNVIHEIKPPVIQSEEKPNGKKHVRNRASAARR